MIIEGYAGEKRNPYFQCAETLTMEEIMQLRYGYHCYIHVPHPANDDQRTLFPVKINSTPKRLKKSDTVRVSVKYGLYEYIKLEYIDDEPTGSIRLVKLID